MKNRQVHPKPKSAQANVPPKPYCDYTIFFRIERAHILQGLGVIDDEAVASYRLHRHDPLEFPRPARYESVIMPRYWYSSLYQAAVKKQRKHRKREGRMDLQTLSRLISANWKDADAEVVSYCRRLADAERRKYEASLSKMKGVRRNSELGARAAPFVRRKSEVVRPNPPMARTLLSRSASAPLAETAGLQERKSQPPTSPMHLRQGLRDSYEQGKAQPTNPHPGAAYSFAWNESDAMALLDALEGAGARQTQEKPHDDGDAIGSTLNEDEEVCAGKWADPKTKRYLTVIWK